MTCDREALVECVYGEMEPGARLALDAHLATCAGCRAELEELSATARTLRQWTVDSPAPSLVVVEAPGQGQRLPGTGWRRWRLGLGLGGLAVALSLLLATGGLRGEYRDGCLTVSLGRADHGAAAAADPLARPATLADLLRVEQQSLALVAAAVEQSDRQNRDDLALAVAGLAQQLQVQRYRDLQAVDQRLVDQDWQTETRFRRNEEVLERLVPVVVSQRRVE